MRYFRDRRRMIRLSRRRCNALRPALRKLDWRERTILHLRYFEDQIQSEIGGQLGLSQTHVSPVIRRALVKLGAAVRHRQ